MTVACPPGQGTRDPRPAPGPPASAPASWASCPGTPLPPMTRTNCPTVLQVLRLQEGHQHVHRGARKTTSWLGAGASPPSPTVPSIHQRGRARAARSPLPCLAGRGGGQWRRAVFRSLGGKQGGRRPDGRAARQQGGWIGGEMVGCTLWPGKQCTRLRMLCCSQSLEVWVWVWVEQAVLLADSNRRHMAVHGPTCHAHLSTHPADATA